MGFETGMWALRLGFGPWDWNLGLETGILALRLEFGPRKCNRRGRTEKEKEKEKIPHMCESIGY